MSSIISGLISCLGSFVTVPTVKSAPAKKVEKVSEGIFTRVPRRVYGGIKATVIGTGSAVAKTVEKVTDFFRRHMKVLLVYGLLGVGLLASQVPLSSVLVHAVPGAWYMMAFQKGDPLVKDWLSPVAPEQQRPIWLPASVEDAQSASLKGRMGELTKLAEEIPLGNFFVVTGQSRVGKTEALHWLSHSLSSRGYPVYRFNLKKFKENSYSGNSERRFLMLENYLAKVARQTGMRPILVTDEYADMITASGLGHAFKEGSAGRYTVLTAMTLNDLAGLSKAHSNRSDMATYELAPLSCEAVKEVLLQVKTKRFEEPYGVEVSDDAVRNAASQADRRSRGQPNMVLNRAVTLLDRACRAAQLDPEHGVIRQDDIRERLANLPKEHTHEVSARGAAERRRRTADLTKKFQDK